MMALPRHMHACRKCVSVVVVFEMFACYRASEKS